MSKIIIRSSQVIEAEDSLGVEILMADSADLGEAIEAIEIRVNVKGPIFWPLAAIQKAALERAQSAIDEEIQRMKSAADRHSS
jgi:hypothetical protein